MADDEMITIDDFDLFGEVIYHRPRPVARRREKKHNKQKKDALAEIKVKMVMRIYGVTRSRALEIIAERAAERRTLDALKEELR